MKYLASLATVLLAACASAGTKSPADGPFAAADAPSITLGADGVETANFPAVSADGKLLVAIDSEGGEEPASNVETLMNILEVPSGKKLASFTLHVEPGVDVDASFVANEKTRAAKEIAAAKRELAKTTWRRMVNARAAEHTGYVVSDELASLTLTAGSTVLYTEKGMGWDREDGPACPTDDSAEVPEDCGCSYTSDIYDAFVQPVLHLIYVGVMLSESGCLSPHQHHDTHTEIIRYK